MSKRLFSFLLIVIALLIGAVYFTNILQSPIVSISTKIQSLYLSTTSYISNTIDEHISQKKHIQQLRAQLQQYQKNHLIMQQLASQLDTLFQANDSNLTANAHVELVRAISYVKFANTNRLWLEMPDFNRSKIYGLVYHERVAGIVVSQDGKPMALLNQDPKSTYAVAIGPDHAPGIARGNNDGNVIVDYIPLWIKIQVGDEVTTSGLDKLFFAGLKVGTVTSIRKVQGYRQAIVKPFFMDNTPNYFYAIKEVY
jgi:rod shape-determining protein MreC